MTIILITHRKSTMVICDEIFELNNKKLKKKMKYKKTNIYQKKFFNSNFNFYKENKITNKNLLFVDRQRLDTAIQNSILTLSICEKKKNLKPLYFQMRMRIL